MSKIFTLMEGNTFPGLEKTLFNPDGTVRDLTGISSAWLHIYLNDQATHLIRSMTPDANPLLGIVRYGWLATDWNTKSGPDANGQFQVGGLIKGVHYMNYEILTPGSGRLTYPNTPDYDILEIGARLGWAP